jgi:hypothetical protein
VITSVQRRAKARFLLAGASATLGLAACTTHPTPTSTSTVTHTETLTRSPAAIPTRPIAAGPTTSVTGTCPLLPLAVAMPIIGQRLDHATVQTSGGKAVGCEFYPITTGPLVASEHLPTGGFPSARITVTTYPSAESARQVLAIVSRLGGSPSRQSVSGLVAETFRTRFYPADRESDWACVFIKGQRLVTVLLAEPTSQGQAIVKDLAESSARHI